MKKLLLLFIIVVFIKIPVAAQVKPGATRDTTQHKPSAETDSTWVKFPLDMRAVKFSRIDSADLSLSPAAPIEKYGVIDTADLKMTSCDFEKDANAMILFDRGEMALGVPEIILERQTRIKIFNDNGKDEANIRIKLNNRFGEERILGIEGETINLDHGKITYTKLQPDQIYRQHTDEQNDEIVFSMPNVKAGSVIEYRYAWARNFSMNFPKWDFQSDIPARYSQLEAFINPMLVFSVYSRTSSAFVQNTASNNGLSHVWALANIPSTKAEPFMRSAADAAEKLMFVISGVDMFGQKKETNKSWADLGKEVAAEKAFYKPYSQDIHDENEITGEAKKLKTDSAKIEFLFNKVKIR